MALRIAETIVGITDRLKIPYVFKGSFKKANRSRVDSFTGIGDEKALKILRKVSETFQIPTVTDIHEVSDAEMAAHFAPLAKALAENEEAIVADFAAAQGRPADTGGYYHTDEAKTAAVMRPSATLNDIIG